MFHRHWVKKNGLSQLQGDTALGGRAEPGVHGQVAQPFWVVPPIHEKRITVASPFHPQNWMEIK